MSNLKVLSKSSLLRGNTNPTLNSKYVLDIRILKILIGCVFLIFLGRGWQFIFWDAPLRSVLWDESLISPIIGHIFGISWESYASNPSVEYGIQYTIIGIGIFLVGSAFVSILSLLKPEWRWTYYCIAISSFILVILSFLEAKEKFYHIAQFFEHSIQFGIPLLLAYVGLFPNKPFSFEITGKIVVAITFFSHGMYAYGFYPVPGHFLDMTISILGISESNATLFLYIAGILDFVIAVGIFIPYISKYLLVYAGIWGLATALARIVAPFDFEFVPTLLHQHLYQVVYRLPHSILPVLLAYLLFGKLNSKQK